MALPIVELSKLLRAINTDEILLEINDKDHKARIIDRDGNASSLFGQDPQDFPARLLTKEKDWSLRFKMEGDLSL